MTSALTLITRYWPLVALVASAVILMTAHTFENMGYAPCTLCLRQREVYWVALVVAGFAAVATRIPSGRRLTRPIDIALALIFLVGAAVAFYHSGVEWKWWAGPQTCASTGAGATAAALDALLEGAEIRPPACDEPNWWFLGLTMANWNILLSLGLAGFSAVAAVRGRGR